MHGIFDERRYLIPFRSSLLPQIFTDVLIIGSGVAGLRAAISAAGTGADVIVLAKDQLAKSNTAWAQGGIAAVTAEGDTVDAHATNTLEAGAGLCDAPVVRKVVGDAPRHIQELLTMGMPFDRDATGALSLGREGGHTASRILHADGDATGRAMFHTLLAAVEKHDRVRLFDNCFALDLITHEQRCVGAVTHHPKYGLQMIWAGATILASGGCGQVYRETTNPKVATGDGLAMAYRAGAEVADLEFMQFHPTTLYVAGASRTLISEAVRGEGAVLINERGERFMVDQHELAELAPRDIVSRAIVHQLASGPDARVYLDARAMGPQRFAERFPGITERIRTFDIEPGHDLIPIQPAAHYMIGGVWADTDGHTNLPGLIACGEASCTGLHGANRLASNSLLEGLVCGESAGRTAAKCSADLPITPPLKLVSDIRPSDRSELDLSDVRASLRSLMWRNVGIERDGRHLADVNAMIDFWARYTLDKIFDDRFGWETQNLLWTGTLMARAAMARPESRGTHYRNDFPASDPALRRHHAWTRGQDEPRVIDVSD